MKHLNRLIVFLVVLLLSGCTAVQAPPASSEPELPTSSAQPPVSSQEELPISSEPPVSSEASESLQEEIWRFNRPFYLPNEQPELLDYAAYYEKDDLLIDLAAAPSEFEYEVREDGLYRRVKGSKEEFQQVLSVAVADSAESKYLKTVSYPYYISGDQFFFVTKDDPQTIRRYDAAANTTTEIFRAETPIRDLKGNGNVLFFLCESTSPSRSGTTLYRLHIHSQTLDELIWGLDDSFDSYVPLSNNVLFLRLAKFTDQPKPSDFEYQYVEYSLNKNLDLIEFPAYYGDDLMELAWADAEAKYAAALSESDA